MDNVVVVGLGMADTLGRDTKECFGNLISDHYQQPESFDTELDHLSHLKAFYARHDDLNYTPLIKPALYKSFSVTNKLALHALEEALEGRDFGQNVAVVFSSIAAKPEFESDYFQDRVKDGKRMSPRVQVQYLHDFVAGLICNAYGYQGAAVSMNAACATGLYSIDYGMHLLRTHDVVIVGGCDNPAGNDDMYFFNQLGALGTHSAPFDKNRDGFIMGEGAGVLVLTTEHYANSNGWPIKAILGPIAHGNDGWHGNATAPDPNATGSTIAMQGVYINSVQDDIAFVNAHGTSTPLGDDLEYNTIQKVVGDVPVVSYKSQIGHTLAASAINETIYTILALQEGIIPPNKNITDCDLNNINTVALKTDKKFAIKNAFAFGGKSSSLLIGVPE